MLFKSLVQGLREDLAHPIGLVQIGAIGVTYLIAWLLARILHQYLDSHSRCIFLHKQYVLVPLCQCGLPGVHIFADIQIMGSHR